MTFLRLGIKTQPLRLGGISWHSRSDRGRPGTGDGHISLRGWSSPHSPFPALQLWHPLGWHSWSLGLEEPRIRKHQRGRSGGQFTSYLCGEKINNEFCFSAEEEIESQKQHSNLCKISITSSIDRNFHPSSYSYSRLILHFASIKFEFNVIYTAQPQSLRSFESER